MGSRPRWQLHTYLPALHQQHHGAPLVWNKLYMLNTESLDPQMLLFTVSEVDRSFGPSTMILNNVVLGFKDIYCEELEKAKQQKPTAGIINVIHCTQFTPLRQLDQRWRDERTDEQSTTGVIRYKLQECGLLAGTAFRVEHRSSVRLSPQRRRFNPDPRDSSPLSLVACMEWLSHCSIVVVMFLLQPKDTSNPGFYFGRGDKYKWMITSPDNYISI